MVFIEASIPSSLQQPLSLAHPLVLAQTSVPVVAVEAQVTYASLSQLAQPCNEKPRRRHIATTMIMFDFAMAALCTLGDDL